MKTKTISFFTISLLLLNSIYSQTHIPSGYVGGTWTSASSPYIIDGEITLDTLDQLIIEPGVDVEFSGHYKFIVHGRLLAEGNEADSINFYPQDTTTGWHGLRFDHTDLNEQDSSKLDYCTIRYGKALSGIIYADSTGGGIRCDSSSLLSIRNSTIERNKADNGGGIYILYSAIVLNHVIVSNNIAEDFDGGGIAFRSSDICIKNSQIYNNTAIDRSGGGIKSISFANYRFEMENVEIFNNSANNEFGGGINVETATADLFFRNVNIYNNSAKQGGGIAGNVKTILCEDVNIFNNHAHHVGGGIFLAFHYNLLSNLRIYGNIADYGAGIHYYLCNGSQLRYCEIFENSATQGGGIVIEDSQNIGFRNLTISENIAAQGAGVSILSNSTAEISSCIFWDNNEGEISIDETSTLDVNYSLISGEYPGSGNIDFDPLFTDPTTNDYSLCWDHYPEPDETKSPCIDSGDPTVLYDPDGTRIDMGAKPFEQTYTPITAGNINGTLLCSESPYYVYGNLTVPEGDQLVIEPCVYMVFQGQYYLRVEGQLLAQGTETDKITICAADSETGWSGVRFSGTSTNGQDSSKLENCRLFWGNVGDGGALYLEYSSDILVKDCHIFNNRASDQGGGIHLFYAAPLLINNIIENNYGKYGGGIYSRVGNYQVHGGIIQNNTAELGGGIYQRGSSPQFFGATIKNNYASRFGGGIYFYQNCSPVFYPADRCNIYDNYAVVAGTDFFGNFSAGAHPTIYVDIFTVINPDKHFIYPYDEFTVDILNGEYAQVADDLYVSPAGSNGNDGSGWGDALLTISHALKIILPDPAIERTIYLQPTTYSALANHENFPLNMRSDVKLCGSSLETMIESDSASNFFYFYDDQNCKLKNITFHGGMADNGGALNLNEYSTPEIESVRFVDNTSSGEGGAVFCEEYSDPLISNSSFTSNKAAGNGGAIACRVGSSPILTHCTFYGNTGYNGGGIYAKTDAHLSLTNVHFIHNSGRKGGGCWFDYDSDPVLTNVSFVSNEATYGNGGGANFSYYSDPVLNNCLFRSNTASHGGGGFSIGSFGVLEMNNSRITGNVAGFGGGLLGGDNCTLTLRNVEITNNTAISTPYSNDEGGGLYLGNIDVSLINVTISDNLTTTDGGAIYCCQSSNISIQNGILWNNIPGAIFIESGTVTAEYSDIEGGWTGTGNMDVNPVFYDILTYDYSLGELSPCIDMGMPDTTGLSLPEVDLAGNSRIGNGRVDMGAYEYYNRHELVLKVFLEGPFNGIDMDTTLLHNGLIPLDQPYNSPPWNYFGIESVSSVPDSVVDWILLELRHSLSYIIITRFPVFLKYNGILTDSEGDPISFQTNIPNIYAVIYHRNHLGIMSATPLVESGGIYSYDFTTPAGQAYGTDTQKNLGSGIYGLYGGDGNADGVINLDDKTTVWSVETGTGGYLMGDFNLDSQTDNRDKNDILLLNIGSESQVPD